MSDTTRPDSYEAALEQLKTILTDLEQRRDNLDVLFEQVQRANQLVEQCKTRLRHIETDIRGIL